MLHHLPELFTIGHKVWSPVQTLGRYADGEPLRPKDLEAIAEMWDKARAYILKHYSGYDVDLAPLIPARAKISAVTAGALALGGEVNIGLKNAWNKPASIRPCCTKSSTQLIRTHVVRSKARRSKVLQRVSSGRCFDVRSIRG